MSMIDEKPEKPVKKGKPSWSFANRLDVKNKSPDFRYRWIDDDPANLDKKLEEGWQLVNKISGIPGEHIEPYGLQDGKKLSSLKTYRGMILAALPNELAEARDEAIAERTELQTAGIRNKLHSKVKSEYGDQAAETVFTRRRGNTIIT